MLSGRNSIMLRGIPMKSLTLRRPDDWHLHLRDGAMLEGVIGDTSRHFARAIIMPNLVPPVVTTADARAYRDRILKAIPAGDSFEPLMTLYLTEDTQANDVEEGKKSGLITAVKLYPAGATTNSHGGVRDFNRYFRPREGFHRYGSGTAAPAPAGAEGNDGAHHHPRWR